MADVADPPALEPQIDNEKAPILQDKEEIDVEKTEDPDQGNDADVTANDAEAEEEPKHDAAEEQPSSDVVENTMNEEAAQQNVPIDFVTMGMFIIGQQSPYTQAPSCCLLFGVNSELTIFKMTSTLFHLQSPSKTFLAAPAPTQPWELVCFLPRPNLPLSAGLSIKAPTSHLHSQHSLTAGPPQLSFAMMRFD